MGRLGGGFLGVLSWVAPFYPAEFSSTDAGGLDRWERRGPPLPGVGICVDVRRCFGNRPLPPGVVACPFLRGAVADAGFPVGLPLRIDLTAEAGLPPTPSLGGVPTPSFFLHPLLYPECYSVCVSGWKIGPKNVPGSLPLWL